MRIALLTHEPFYPPSGGGSAEVIYLVRELVRRKHQVHLFCPAFQNQDEVAQEFGVQVHPFTLWAMGRYSSLRTLKYLLFPWFLQRQVRQIAQQTTFDVVVSQHAIAAVAGGQVKARLGIPCVMNFLDYLTGFMETWPRYVAPMTLIRALERYEISLPNRYAADGVLTVSDPLADRVVAAGYPRAQVQPMYYGFDAARFRPPDATPTADAAPVVVMHGSFDRHHLGPIALAAIAQVFRERPDVRFRFVGRRTSTLEKFCARVMRVVPGVSLECPGFVPYESMAAQLGDAALGMVPYEESTGVHCAFVAKIVEYLGVGLPVVSTSLLGATRYFAKEPAVTFAGFTGDEFGKAILAWLDKPAEQRRALGRRASEQVARDLDWQVLCRRAVDFIEQTTATSRSAPTPGT